MQWKNFATEESADIIAELESSSSGLSSRLIEERLKVSKAEQAEEPVFPLVAILKRRLSSSFLYLLIAAASLSFFLGEFLEGIFILIFILINLSLETYQEYHSQKALGLLKKYLVVHARVRRDGKIVTVESSSVVTGDILLLEAGDRLPADIRFLLAKGIVLDESIITGESIGVEKIADVMDISPGEMYEARNIGFAGTSVTTGSGEGIVLATGKDTALGDIASLTSSDEKETVFEKGIKQFSGFIVKLVLFTITIIYFANLLIKGPAANGIELLIFSLALAVSVVPEALPVILTVALSRGSIRLAQKKVIVKRLSAIEDLGSIEILCTDKTGTLTENMLSVTRVKAADERKCLTLAFASCLAEPTERGKLHDAFDLALWQSLTEKEHREMERIKRLDGVSFDPERRRNSALIERDKKQEVVVRGAPEEIFKLSRNVDSYTSRSLMQWVAEAGYRGERVLAVAIKPFSDGRKFSVYEEQHLEFVGLISFADVLKKTAKETLLKAKALNIEVKILTGDSAEVAGAVGAAVGLIKDAREVCTGKQLKEMEESQRRRAIFSHAVFARVSPRQKYEIIKVLQEKHEVGFLGEGINDAPALGLANVAIVVQGASDIARESADVVLLQKSLDTVIDGIREGRIIFANILKYLKITLTSNFGNFYSVALSSLFLPFVPLLPIQILLLNLLSDFPMIALATDRVDPEELEKPKNYQVHSIVLFATFLGIVSSVFDFILFGALSRVSAETMQTSWFLLSVITEVILIFSLRTKFVFFKAPKASFLLVYLSMIVLVTVFFLPYIPPISKALGFISPSPKLMFFIAGLSLLYFLATEAVKSLYGRHVHALHVSKIEEEKKLLTA